MKAFRQPVPTLLLFVLFGLPAPSAGRPAAAGAQKPSKAPAGRSEQRPDPLASLLQQAGEALEKKDFAAALPPLQSYVAQRPEDAVANFQLGYAYSGLERWEDARAAYQRAIALNPQLAAAHLNLGLLLLDREPAAAVEPFRHAAELLPDQSRPRFLLGLAFERSGSLAAAVEQYQFALSLDGKDFETHFALGRALLGTGRPAEAEARFRHSLALRPDSAPGRLGLAESLLAQKKLEAAADEFGTYLKLQPGDRESRARRASVLTDLKRYDLALAELDAGDQGAPPSLPSYKLRAEIYLAQKQLIQAAETLQQALQLAPQDAELHARLGRLWLEKREFAPAERELRIALQIDRNWTDALRDLVAVYYLGGQYQATLEALDLLAARESPAAGSWFVRATCYDRLDKKPEAVAAYETFLSLDEGRNEDQRFQARHRIRILKKEIEKKKK